MTAVTAAAGLACAALAGWLALPEVRSPDPGRTTAPRARRLTARRLPSERAMAAGGLVALAAAYALGPVRGAIVPVGVGGLLALVTRRRLAAARARRRGAILREQDVKILRALAGELRAGLSAVEAMRAVSTTGFVARDGPPTSRHIGLDARLGQAATIETLGGDPGPVLAQAPGCGAALAASWAVSRRTGAALAEPVRRIADAAAAELRLTREVDAALASARSSAHLLALLPAAGALLGALSGTGSLRVLLASGAGQLCLLVGVLLELAGLRWLDRLAGRAAR